MSAPRCGRAKTGPSGRTSKANYKAACYSWAEFDNPGDQERIEAVLQEKKLQPAITVVTGTTPNLRAHLYFRIEKVEDIAKIEAANKALQTLLDSDPVFDAGRVMRLAGSINHPTKKKRDDFGYVTELTTLHLQGARRATRSSN